MTSASVRDAQLLNELSHALLTAIHSNNDRTTRYTGPGGSFCIDRDKCYIYLIYALIKKDEWCQRLAHDDLHDRCIPLLGRLSRPDVVDRSGAVFYKYNLDTEAEFCFLVIFGRIKSSDKGLLFSPDESLRWLLLITRTWKSTPFGIEDDDYVNGIPAVVTAARLTLTALDDGVPREWLADVAANVHLALVRLQERQARLVNKGIAQAAIDAALSSMQGLHTEFSRMVKQWNTSGKNRNRGSLGDRYIQDRRNRDTTRHDDYGSTFFYITHTSHHHGVSDEAPSSGKPSVTNLGSVRQTFSNLW
ncbi:hypothetical protein EV702DRAFT_142271 [Suillus placidus]|uniref:Uncharacterized protein n=1 Tax=Suillus placidus TaxID=48579 RepID=A0A9P6ZZU9_9AGAM|nr:hypothetical protein EV702DRAFT_142271 [Suillus placidus]